MIFVKASEMVHTSDEKRCYKCSLFLTLDNFSPAKANKDGLMGICKKCRIIEQREWNINNKEKRKEIEKRSNSREERRKQIREYDRRRYHNNPNRKAQMYKAIKKYQNSDKGIASLHRADIKRRNILLATTNTLTASEWTAIREAYDYRCAYCGESKPLEKDHLVPLSRGGEHTLENVVPSCRSCNASKGNRIIDVQESDG